LVIELAIDILHGEDGFSRTITIAITITRNVQSLCAIEWPVIRGFDVQRRLNASRNGEDIGQGR
jgi:hypothetical protein